MKKTPGDFFRTMISQLNLICTGKYDATDELLKFTDNRHNDPEVVALAETMGLMSVKLEAREMALEKTIAELEQNLVERKQLGIFFILFTFFISLFTFVSAYLNQSSSLSPEQLDTIAPLVCMGFLPVLIILSLIQIHFSSFSIREFGLTFRGSKKAIIESLIVTTFFIGLMTLFRWWCGSHFRAFEGTPFFNTSLIGYSFWTYLFVAPAQEFVARGMVQTTLYRLMPGSKHGAFWAILLASLIFGVTHTFFSFWISIISIVAGLLWGWLYSRHQTILGVALSHFLLGNYAMLMGFWTLME